MRSSWRRTVGRLAACLLALLTLLPLVASSHQHRTDGASSPESCPACVAKASSPATPLAGVPNLAPTLRSFAIVTVAVAVPGYADQPFRPGRAPPLSTPTHRA